MGLATDVDVITENELFHDYKSFVNDIPVALFRVDLNTGRFLIANKQCMRLLGYEDMSTFLSTARFFDVCGKPGRIQLLRLLKSAASTVNFEVKLRRKDGSLLWASTDIQVNWESSWIEGSMTDITSTKRLEREDDKIKASHLTKQSDINIRLKNMIKKY